MDTYNNEVNSSTEDSVKAFKFYKRQVKKLAKLDSKGIFPNRSNSHASIVMSIMTKKTEKSIKIFDRNLSGDILVECFEGRLMKKIKEAADKRISIDFIIEQDEVHSDLLEILSMENVNLYIASPKLVTKLESRDITGYFSIFDEKMFRVQKSRDNSREAFCSFNGPKIAKKILTTLSENKDFLKKR